MVGTYMSFILLTALVMSSVTSTTTSDLHLAMEEMQKANYFTFVLLLNMSPFLQQNNNLGNLTFLIPNDKLLSGITIPQHSVSEFILLHSIPSPLLFDHLDHIPTGSLIPSSLPNFMLKIANNGRRSYHVNNVKIISPNICTAGDSIRCHGINGVITATNWNNDSGNCVDVNNSSRPVISAATPPTSSLPPRIGTDQPPAPAATPAPMPATDPNSGTTRSGSSELLPFGSMLLSFVMVMVSTVGFLVY